LLIGPFEAVDILLVFARAERRDHKRLSLAARKQCGTMRAWQNAGLGKDRPHSPDITAIDTNACIENVPAHDLGLKIVKHSTHGFPREARLLAFREQRCHHFRAHFSDSIITLLLDGMLV